METPAYPSGILLARTALYSCRRLYLRTHPVVNDDFCAYPQTHIWLFMYWYSTLTEYKDVGQTDYNQRRQMVKLDNPYMTSYLPKHVPPYTQTCHYTCSYASL